MTPDFQIDDGRIKHVHQATLENILADYTEQCRLEWKVRHDQESLRVALEKLLAGERLKWSRAVNQVLYNRRPGWTYYESDVFYVINHATRPMTVSIIVRVKVWYNVLLRSGTLELSGNIKEKQDVLKELRRSLLVPHPVRTRATHAGDTRDE
jgi:hypothetical protein